MIVKKYIPIMIFVFACTVISFLSLAIVSANENGTSTPRPTLIPPYTKPQPVWFGNFGCLILSEEKKEVAIVGIENPSAELVFPSIIEGYKVVRIGLEDAYEIKGNSYVPMIKSVDVLKIKKVVIPNGVVKIGYSAFNGCRNLEKINIPSTVKNIGESTFSGCESLKRIHIPDGINVGEFAFSGCTGLTELVIPNASGFCHNSFSGCESLKKITYRNNVKEVVIRGFQFCENIKKIIIPKNVKKVHIREFNWFYEEKVKNLIIKGSKTKLYKKAWTYKQLMEPPYQRLFVPKDSQALPFMKKNILNGGSIGLSTELNVVKKNKKNLLTWKTKRNKVDEALYPSNLKKVHKRIKKYPKNMRYEVYYATISIGDYKKVKQVKGTSLYVKRKGCYKVRPIYKMGKTKWLGELSNIVEVK